MNNMSHDIAHKHKLASEILYIFPYIYIMRGLDTSCLYCISTLLLTHRGLDISDLTCIYFLLYHFRQEFLIKTLLYTFMCTWRERGMFNTLMLHLEFVIVYVFPLWETFLLSEIYNNALMNPNALNNSNI